MFENPYRNQKESATPVCNSLFDLKTGITESFLRHLGFLCQPDSNHVLVRKDVSVGLPGDEKIPMGIFTRSLSLTVDGKGIAVAIDASFAGGGWTALLSRQEDQKTHCRIGLCSFCGIAQVYHGVCILSSGEVFPIEVHSNPSGTVAVP